MRRRAQRLLVLPTEERRQANQAYTADIRARGLPRRTKMAQVDQIKTHWSYARKALTNAASASTESARAAYAAEASARIEACRFLWGWPESTYGALQ